MTRSHAKLTWTLALLALLVPAVSFSAGFAIFEHGTKAMGMAGAFTAQADDPSAMFHNAGGLAFLNEREFLLGATFIKGAEADFTGSDPFPGAGVTAEQESLSAVPPHFYWVEPISKTMSFGLGVNSPFGLSTEWKDPDNFPGRFISERAEIIAIDVNPTVGFKVSENFGFGIGAIVRMSSVEVDMRQATLTPFGPLEIAKLGLESDTDMGLGFNIGMLHKVNESFSWGLSYRSRVTIDYGGSASFQQVLTGIPPIDAGVAFLLPDNPVPISTSIEFPDIASLGGAFAISPKTLIEIDINWAGWSSFDRLVVESSVPGVGLELDENYDDAMNYRVGLKWGRGAASEWRFGYVYDETPQPDEAVSPLLPDANRNGFTVGYGHQGSKYNFDLAFMYLPFDSRSTSTNDSGFNGTYETTAWLLGASFGF